MTTKIIHAAGLRLVYVILPKCGCTSAKSYICTADPRIPLKVSATQATSALEGIFGPYTQELPGPEDIYQFGKEVTFTFVRDPTARLISLFNEKVVAKLYPPLAVFGIRAGMSFSEFVDCVCAAGDETADDHFRSQSSMIVHKGEVVPNLVSTVDTISEIIPRLLAISGFPWEQPHYHHRKSAQATADAELDASVLRNIRARYADDFELFSRVANTPHVRADDSGRLARLGFTPK